MARCHPAPQGWGDLARWLRCSSVTEVKAMLPRRASPASQIPSSKIEISSCTDPKQGVPSLPKDERYRLGDQMLRAARSTTANIAEGYGRFHFLDNAKFCSNSRGSCWEVLDHLITGQDEGLLSREHLDHGRQLVADAVKVLNGYLHYLQRAAQSRHEPPDTPAGPDNPEPVTENPPPGP